MKSFFRTKQLLSLFICLVIVSSLAIVKHGELLGHSFRSEQKPQAANNDTLRILGNGTAVINTSALASDITGYGGKVPLNIVIKNGVVENIVALKNDETKEFFDNASALFEKWKGRTIDEAMNMKVDAVTGGHILIQSHYRKHATGTSVCQEQPADRRIRKRQQQLGFF